MASWRRGRLVRTVVAVLLLWTATDLTNASLCALDSEDVILLTAADVSIDDTSGQPPPASRGREHIDDCFCCSHCVDVQAVLPSTLVLPLTLQHTTIRLAPPRLFGVPLFHPPLV